MPFGSSSCTPSFFSVVGFLYNFSQIESRRRLGMKRHVVNVPTGVSFKFCSWLYRHIECGSIRQLLLRSHSRYSGCFPVAFRTISLAGLKLSLQSIMVDIQSFTWSSRLPFYLIILKMFHFFVFFNFSIQFSVGIRCFFEKKMWAHAYWDK